MSFHCHWRIHCSCRNGDAVDKTRNNPHSPTGTLSIDRVTQSDSESNPEADKLWFYIQSMTLVFPSRVCRLYRGAGGFFWLKCQPAAGEETDNYLNCNHFPGVSHSIETPKKFVNLLGEQVETTLHCTHAMRWGEVKICKEVEKEKRLPFEMLLVLFAISTRHRSPLWIWHLLSLRVRVEWGIGKKSFSSGSVLVW